MCLFCLKLHVLYFLSLNLCYKWKIDYVTIHILPQKIRVGCIYFDADPVGVGVIVRLMLAYALIYAQYILNGLLDFDQNMPVYNTWTCQNPD